MLNFEELRLEWQFTPTKWHSVADKEKFARHYIAFVQARCPLHKFHEWFYNRLTHLFMHIAHYNRLGFYETWCATPAKRLALLRRHFEHECAGDPAWTWSDVKQTLQGWIRESGVLREYEAEAVVARRQTALTAAKLALRELTDEEVQWLWQERRGQLVSVDEHGKKSTLVHAPLAGEQQELFRL